MPFENLLMHFAREIGASVIIRGLARGVRFRI
jgi:phosphopantetheine adenylyltransferase